MENPIVCRNRHSVYVLEYHLVVVTKYRHPVLQGPLKDRLIELSYKLLTEGTYDCEILSINTDLDHVHILFRTAPQVQLSKLVNTYKTVTARHIRKEFAKELQAYYQKPVFWSSSYFVATVSERTRNAVDEYIKKQGG